MPEILHTDVSRLFQSYSGRDLPQVFYIWGEPYLCRSIFDKIVNFILPRGHRDMGYELLEGEDAVIPSIIERLSTYSFFQDRLVIALKDIPLLPPPGTASAPGFQKNDIESLKKSIEKTFPQGHFLVMTAPSVDRRRAIFQTIKDKGFAIDCSMPSGSTKADKTKQDAFLRFTMEDVLQRAQKGIDTDAYAMLTRQTGFDPATLADSLEKLVSFIGERPSITLKDVTSLVKNTRKEPIFQLTNAVIARNADQAIYYFKKLIDDGFPPIPMLSAIAKQMRKLLVVKQFVEGEKQRGSHSWRPKMNFNMFIQTTMPRVLEVDSAIAAVLEKWGENLEPEFGDRDPDRPGEAPGFKKNKKKLQDKSARENKAVKKKKPPSDLYIAPNPRNTYPVYQTFLKSDLFSLDEICGFMIEISDIDYKMKTSSQDSGILLELFIMRVCRAVNRL